MQLRQLPSGRWLVRVSYMQDGRQKELSKTFPRKRDAEKWQRAQESDRDRGTLDTPTRLTVGEYLDRWLRDLTGVGGRTREDYENITRRYLTPALGTRRLSHLTPPQVREALADLTKRGLSPRTVGYARAVLRRALNQAVSDGVIRANPAAGHGLAPKPERREPSVLSAAQVHGLIAATTEDPHGPLWAVLLTTGLRPSEALGLRWTDVHLTRRTLRVMRKLRRPGNGTAALLEDVKTAKGRRVVSLVPLAVDALTRQRDRQVVEKLVAEDGYTDTGLVFADPRGNPLRADGLYKYHWQPMLTRLQLPPVRLYDARHSAATMLLEAGVPMKVVQEMLGHSSMTITADTYSHVTPAFQRQAADALTAYLDAAAQGDRKARASE
jgi:integrase